MTTVRITNKEILQLAKKCNLYEKCVRRLLKSLVVYTKIPTESEGMTQYNITTFAIGLNLEGVSYDNLSSSATVQNKLLSMITEGLKEYRNCSPQIVKWVGRGDFNAQKVPEYIDLATLKHACRTASRLRAHVLKQLQIANDING